MLLYYFTDKADALASALDCLAARLMALLASASAEPLPEVALWDRLSSQARDPALWPYLCLWLEIAARAARGEPFWADRGRALGQGFHDWIAAQLDAPARPAQRGVACALPAPRRPGSAARRGPRSGAARPEIGQHHPHAATPEHHARRPQTMRLARPGQSPGTEPEGQPVQADRHPSSCTDTAPNASAREKPISFARHP